MSKHWPRQVPNTDVVNNVTSSASHRQQGDKIQQERGENHSKVCWEEKLLGNGNIKDLMF